ncbi:hypothetical protein BBJ66_29405 [Rhizobium sp. RSm-3]|uniref:hypothetical protein n=1 Tax=unclassified Rhizobium TaxID=2613769 RepID=UPI0008DABBE3|nr:MULTISPECIES: hypothetical protein [unclassified Rhizobium]OHV22585.1 hypothetical protein BBJ66_29405 [Rhizobium sp. RSm-3]
MVADHGLYLHAMIGVDADDGAIVGAIHGQFLSRDQGKRGTQRARPIEEKESYRWLEGADHAAKVCAAARHITVIADRESDIYEAFTRRPANVDLVVRAAKDRSFGKDQPSLFAMADALPVAMPERRIGRPSLRSSRPASSTLSIPLLI